MEGKGENLPQEKGSEKGSTKTKTIAIAIGLIVVIAAILGAFLLMGGGNKNPTAKISVSNDSITVGTPVVFSGNQSSDSDGSIKSYFWEFGDGTNQTTTTAQVSHTYGYPGDYLAVLTVKDDKDAKASTWLAASSVKVLPAEVVNPTNDTAPVSNIVLSNTVFNKNTVVTCDATSSAAWQRIWDPVTRNMTTGLRGIWKMDSGSGYVDSLKWQFTDSATEVTGNMTQVGNVNHTFSRAGIAETVWLTVYSWKDGVSSKAGKTIIALPDGVTPTSGVKNPNAIIHATSGEPESLDPAYDYESAGGNVIQSIYETLLWYNGTSPDNLKPYLATAVPTKENGLISADGKNYTFNLRSNVKFHNGETMKGYDVFYSIKRMLMENNAFSPAWMFGEVLIPGYYGYDMPPFMNDPLSPIPEDDINNSMTYNDTSITFHLLYPYPAFNKVIAYTAGAVISSKYVEEHGGIQRYWRNVWMDTHECGTGPFKLASWVKGAVVKLERFDQYWQTQKAKVKYVYIEKYESMATRDMLLKKGDADIVYVPFSASEPFVKTPNKDYYISRGNYTFNLGFLGFNQAITVDPSLPVGNIPADFFNNTNVRLAFCHVFNVSAYIKEVAKGNAIQPNGPIPKGMFGYDANISAYSFDPELAAEYLKKAINPATNRSWAEDGFSIKLYYNIGNDDREKGCLMFKQNLEALSTNGLINGTISVTYQGLDWASAYLPAQRGQKLAIFFLGWAPDFADPHDYAFPFLHSTGTYPSTCGWGNTTLDAMIEAAAQEENVTARAQMYSEISQACQDNGYYLWTSQTTSFDVMRSWVKGYIYNPMFSDIHYYTMYKSTV